MLEGIRRLEELRTQEDFNKNEEDDSEGSIISDCSADPETECSSENENIQFDDVISDEDSGMDEREEEVARINIPY